MGIKLTKKRQQILQVLKKHKGILSADDVHKKIPEIDLVTIYRNLDLLSKEGLISRIDLGKNKAQYEYQEKPHYHAICEKCQKVVHFSASDEKIRKLLKINDFQIEKIDVTVRGVCRH